MSKKFSYPRKNGSCHRKKTCKKGVRKFLRHSYGDKRDSYDFVDIQNILNIRIWLIINIYYRVTLWESRDISGNPDFPDAAAAAIMAWFYR